MKRLILLGFCLYSISLFAQSATDYFHISANYYANADKKNAQKTIQEGIHKYPDNAKLKNLANKIAELPDPEDQQDKNNQQNQDNQDQKDQQNQDQKDQQQKPEDQKSEQQQKQQQQQQQLSREDAQRMLDAIAQEEKDLQEKLQKKERAGDRGKIEKNW